MLKPTSEWNEEYIFNNFIQTRRQEDINLDYKACGALDDSERKKDNISKDVSAFANSAGGVIIYGVMEDKTHFPTGFDVGYDPSIITKEWLEQVINSSIKRRIDGIRIYPFELTKHNPGRYFYVVDIPQSESAPHQAKDKRFYKRFNFESVPMEEYEVRDIMNRSTGPDLSLHFEQEFHLSSGTGDLHIEPCILNSAVTPAEYAIVTFWIDRRLFHTANPQEQLKPRYFHSVSRETEVIQEEDYSFDSIKAQFWYQPPRMVIFGHQPIRLFPEGTGILPIKIPTQTDPLVDRVVVSGQYFIRWQIESPKMLTKTGMAVIEAQGVNKVSIVNNPQLVSELLQQVATSIEFSTSNS